MPKRSLSKKDTAITEADIQNFIKKYIGEITGPIDRKNVEEVLRVSMQENKKTYEVFENK